MPHARYLRLYDTTVIGLARRGHDVMLAYDKPSKAKGQAVLPDEAPSNLRCIGDVPRHAGPWGPFLRELGCVTDYVRFLSPEESSPYLRMRMEKYLPERYSSLKDVKVWPALTVRAAVRLLRFVERAVPVDPALLEYLRTIAPDVVVVTPLVFRGPLGVQQTQLVKAARRLGIPVALAVGSWDHLSSKGLIRTDPDRVFVWNETQKREAVRMHRVPPARVVVTGAQPFDRWFTASPSMTRDSFLERVGLPAGTRHMILYVGSSRGIADPAVEVPFVRRWLKGLRSSTTPEVKNASVLIRPHPFNMESWQTADMSGLGPVSIWPSVRPSFPMSPEEATDYFHSLYYSHAVVGINTSAMIEASIVGRQVYTLQFPEFAGTQEGTTHFHYLMPEEGGCVLSARSMDAHVQQLSGGLSDPGFGKGARDKFVASFVRPNGNHPAVDDLIAAIERLGTIQRRPFTDRPWWLAPVRVALAGPAHRMPATSVRAPRPKPAAREVRDAS